MIKRDFATLVEIELTWALKFNVRTNSTPKNLMVGLGERANKLIEETRLTLGVHKKLLELVLIISYMRTAKIVVGEYNKNLVVLG
jgi:hypothetical protein